MQIAKENKICIAPFFRAALLELRNPIRRRALSNSIWCAYGGVYLDGIVNIMDIGKRTICKIKDLSRIDNGFSNLRRGKI